MSADVTWVKYIWDLPGAAFEAPLPSGYEARSGRAGEAQVFVDTTVAAYASDPTWSPLIASIRQRMGDRVAQTYDAEDSEYLCVTSAGAIVAVSGMAETHWTQQNFLTGPCVLPGHQRKGLGTYLLATSLAWLRDRGCREGAVFTEEGSIADAKIYPRFGSRRIAGVDYVDPPKAQG